MPLKDILTTEVGVTMTDGTKWQVEKARVVPAVADLNLSANHAKHFDSATVLYADLDGSTDMVNTYHWWFSAEVYKAYLKCAGRIIKEHGGVITAYDGDRIMAVFIGDEKNRAATKAAMQIRWAVDNIINPTIKARWPKTDFVLKHVIGIDTSPLHAARIGVHNDNDLVWVGRAANYAAKLCAYSSQPLWITEDVFKDLDQSTWYAGQTMMWEKHEKPWAATKKHSINIYSSRYSWTIA